MEQHSQESMACNQQKLSHKKWRALQKRQKRKLRRQEEAKIRDEQEQKENKKAESSPSYIARQREEEEKEKLCKEREEAERVYLNKLWEEKERLAQEEWKRKKEWEAKEKIRREETEKKIREEWEERQRKEKEEEKVKEKKKEKQYCQLFNMDLEELLKQATANENKEGPWHNPIATVIQGKERETCMFFSKTGTCRFGDRCSRGHPQPDVGNTLLFPGMYSHFELEQGLRDEYDTDLILEYEDGELYQNFKDFYEDIVPEFKAIGKVTQVKVCCNYEPHLRGNVYIQYRRIEEAQEAFMRFNGRFYGGKQLSCEYVDIHKWKSAICGLFGTGRCPKGRNCNFLHVFRNPMNEFRDADIDYERSSFSHRNGRDHFHRSHRQRSRSRDKHRSRDRERRHRSRNKDRKYSKSRSRSRSRVKHKKHRRTSRSQSRSPSRYSHRRRSRSRSESKTKSRSESDAKHHTHKDYKVKSPSKRREDSVKNGITVWPQEGKWDSEDETVTSVVNDQHQTTVNLEQYYMEQDSDSDRDSVKYPAKKHKKHKKHKYKINND